MVSSRAKEYITRFSKGVQNEIALKKIVEYRDDCKVLYNNEDSKNHADISGKIAKMEYLKDMAERIRVLGEARDYLQEQIKTKDTKGRAKKPVAMSKETEKLTRSGSFKCIKNPNKITKEASKEAEKKAAKEAVKKAKNLYERNDLLWAKKKYRPVQRDGMPHRYDIESRRIHVDSRSYFTRTPDHEDIRDKNANVIKYIMRYQHFCLPSDPMSIATGDPAISKADAYLTEWINEMNANPDDDDYKERFEIAESALLDTIRYFEELSAKIYGFQMEADSQNTTYNPELCHPCGDEW